jgi:hypothetical protein
MRNVQEKRSCVKNLGFFNRNWIEYKFINKCLSLPLQTAKKVIR